MRRLRARRPGDVALALGLALHLLPLLLLERVVTTDGPGHLAGGHVLGTLLLGGPDRPVLAESYRLDVGPDPNLLTTVLLAVLLRITGPDAAERLLVAGYVVLLLLGLRYALRGADPRAGWLAVLGVPLVGSYLFTYGFYNYCLAVGLALVVIGLGLRRREGWTAGTTALLLVLLGTSWATHLLPTVVAGMFLVVLAGLRTAAAWPQGPWPAARRHLLPVVLAGLPALALTVVFVLSPGGERGAAVHRPLAELLVGLLTLGRVLVAYTPAEYVPSVVVAAVLVALAVRAVRACRPATPERRALAVTAALCTLAYLASPDRLGRELGFLNDRWAIFPVLFLLLWLAGPPPAPRRRRAVAATVLAATLALLLVRLPTELAYQRQVEEFLSVAPAVPAGSTVVSVRLWRSPPVGGDARNRFRDPLRHQASRLAVRVGGVDAGHYEAAYDYFPVTFRAGRDPRVLLDPGRDELSDVPPDVSLAAAAELVDVVLLVGRRQADPADLASPLVTRLLAELSADYRRVAVSDRTGLVEVWVRR